MAIRGVGGLRGIDRAVERAAKLHTVKRGETLGSIAKLFRVGRDTLATANPKLGGAEPKVGTRLTIPSVARTVANRPAGSDSFERLGQTGETFAGRARLEVRKETLAALGESSSPHTSKSCGCGDLPAPADSPDSPAFRVGDLMTDTYRIGGVMTETARIGDRMTETARIGDVMTDAHRGGDPVVDGAAVFGGLDSQPETDPDAGAAALANYPGEASPELSVRKQTLAELVEDVAHKFPTVGTTSK